MKTFEELIMMHSEEEYFVVEAAEHEVIGAVSFEANCVVNMTTWTVTKIFYCLPLRSLDHGFLWRGQL